MVSCMIIDREQEYSNTIISTQQLAGRVQLAAHDLVEKIQHALQHS